MAHSKEEQAFELEESKAFLKSILLPDLEKERCIDNQMALSSALYRYESDIEEEDETQISLNTSTESQGGDTEKVFSQGNHDKSMYFISLNMIGERIYIEDNPPFFLTIISRNEDAHKNLDKRLDCIAKYDTYGCSFIHDLKAYPEYDFKNRVSRIPLDDTHLKFLKDLFADNNEVLDLVKKVESKILAFNARNKGHQTLAANLQDRNEVHLIEMIQHKSENKQVVYLKKVSVDQVENLTAKDLAKLLSEMAYAYISMSQADYDLLHQYFSQMGKPDALQVAQKMPLIVGIQFATINEASIVVREALFPEEVLSPAVKAILDKQIENLKYVFEQFDLAYDFKLHQHYANQFQQENDTIILSAAQKPAGFYAGFQSDVQLYKSQCQIGYFLSDQLKNGAKEKILHLAPIQLPDEVFFVHGDTLLAHMLGGKSDCRKTILSDDENPSIYAGWDYGLKFVDLDPTLKKIYCDQGRDLVRDNLALSIPLANLTLYFMLRYLDLLQENNQTEVFNDVLRQTAQFIIYKKLSLPEKYHSMFDNPSVLSAETNQKIHELYEQLRIEQIQDRNEYLKLANELDNEIITILDNDTDDEVNIVDIEEDNEVKIKLEASEATPETEEQKDTSLQVSRNYGFFDNSLSEMKKEERLMKDFGPQGLGSNKGSSQ
ncbi:hypothetical protein DGG96_11140 [Legionella qingyii]|uniref:Uncharacterized protein n=1 Tax=Legionella qingyii TaxID=2184757 RepID=A0A317U1M8_9GAMM|nr:hypothetical protein [Legionella qingyii]PWY55651.1 hypothetical protein DGG96_11140 [Legionella qingyii]RUR21755.1 hypothetical protein ELY20_11030 [Legionella qingyii]RUR25317.1 hypothetical protein ELY16_10320 [Legionella qingyii]